MDGFPEKLEALAAKFRALQEKIKNTNSKLDDIALEKAELVFCGLIAGLEKSIDGMEYLVDRLFNE